MLQRRLCLLVVAIITLIGAPAQAANHTMTVDSVRLIRQGDKVQMMMELNFDRKQVGSDDVLLVAPFLASPEKAKVLPSVGVYGRNTYYYYVREGWVRLQETGAIRLRAKEAPLPYRYVQTVDYEDWMQQSIITINVSLNHACEGEIEQRLDTVLALHPIIIVTPDSVETIRGSIAKTAHVDFIVNRTEIRPDYHDNARELAGIAHTIDSMKAQPETKITGIGLKGYASPEGPYWNNIRLAKGRTEALRDHIIEHHGISPSVISADYEPEDWQGLRRDVAASDLPHKNDILRIIDTEEEPDARLARIKRRFPADYAVILAKIMPYLRHTDYHIDFETLAHKTKQGHADTLWALPEGELLPETPFHERTFHPDWALKTNLIGDAVLAFNFEVEVPFGKDREWSLMAEDWFPWYVWHHNSRAYEIWAVGLELRKWWGKCPGRRPALSGNFAGLYLASGKYDWEWSSTGDQGEFISTGVTYGYSWPLSKHWNLEASASIGAVWGPRRHYNGEFQDTHLIWKYNSHIFYAGPTKIKLSLVWLLESPFRKKGGRL
ncbi:MAG: DUF3575 domain-containing protein [Prevotella sp.]|nr:DUF3575 domain-containing protein [Prevotella sp.]